MPTYEYECKECVISQEVIRGFKDEEVFPPCPSCGHKMTKVYGVPGISFKGSGFYKTDNPK